MSPAQYSLTVQNHGPKAPLISLFVSMFQMEELRIELESQSEVNYVIELEKQQLVEQQAQLEAQLAQATLQLQQQVKSYHHLGRRGQLSLRSSFLSTKYTSL